MVRELHTAEDLIAIGEWIGPDQTYYLQQFVDSGNVIQSGFTAYTKEEMEALRDAVAPLVPSVTLRGIREG